MSLSAFAVRRPVTTVAATLAIVLLGSVSLTRLPVTLLPDVTLPVLTVRTTDTGEPTSMLGNAARVPRRRKSHASSRSRSKPPWRPRPGSPNSAR